MNDWYSKDKTVSASGSDHLNARGLRAFDGFLFCHLRAHSRSHSSFAQPWFGPTVLVPRKPFIFTVLDGSSGEDFSWLVIDGSIHRRDFQPVVDIPFQQWDVDQEPFPRHPPTQLFGFGIRAASSLPVITTSAGIWLL